MSDNQFDWMDVESNGCVQMGVQDNNVFYQGYADYLGVVPEGMVLGVSTSETADGMPGITFVAAVKYDLYNETLNLTMIDGQNPFAEGKTQLQLIRCPDPLTPAQPSLQNTGDTTMKHNWRSAGIPAVLLAALLAGCGAKTAASARPAGSRELKLTPPDSMHATAAITEQYTLEKVVQAENGGKVRLNIHLPRLESDSADAARINAEIARYYEYDVQEYADCPEAADPESWDICIEMNWNASWYGDCVSLVVSSCYGGTDAPFHQRLVLRL